MILYLGSSSLIKLYAREVYSEELREWVRTAEIVATCRIAYTEVMSVLEMRFKRGDVSADDYSRAVERFGEDWESLARLDFDDRQAGGFIKKYGLTRFGALHLSAAKLVREEVERGHAVPAKGDVDRSRVGLFFSSADQALLKAARAEGLTILRLD
jgi:uncharacterized protein